MITHKAKQLNRTEYACSCGFGPHESLIPVAEHIKKERKKEDARSDIIVSDNT